MGKSVKTATPSDQHGFIGPNTGIPLTEFNSGLAISGAKGRSYQKRKNESFGNLSGSHGR